MNRLSKILLVIIIILVIFFGMIIYSYYKQSKENLQNVLDSAEEIHQLYKAISEAGFDCEEQDDGTYKLVEKIND
jgi:uncharacterized protein YpmB